MTQRLPEPQAGVLAEVHLEDWRGAMRRRLQPNSYVRLYHTLHSLPCTQNTKNLPLIIQQSMGALCLPMLPLEAPEHLSQAAESRRWSRTGAASGHVRLLHMCIHCCKHADNSEAAGEPLSGGVLNMCTLRTKYPAADVGSACAAVSQGHLERMSKHAGRADLEASATIEHLSLCDPDLLSAHAPALLNAMELVDVFHTAVMCAAQDSQRTQQTRP